jgi:hypothetical protein
MSDKSHVIAQLITGFVFETEEIDKDHASVTRFAHGRHAFQIRYPDGRVFRVAVEEWDEGRQQQTVLFDS